METTERTYTDEEVDQFIKDHVQKHFKDFMYTGDLDWNTWAFFISRNRDSDNIENSNYEVILKYLQERFPDDVTDERHRHFMCGWVEFIRFNIENRDAVRAVMQWKDKLDDYPIADEDDVSRRDYEDAASAWENWAQFDVKSLIEDMKILALVDEDGYYNANDEQESKLIDLITNQVLDHDGSLDEESFREVLLEEFGG